MSQLAGSYLAEESFTPAKQEALSRTEETPWEKLQRLTEAGASAIGLPNGLLASHRAGWQSDAVLMPTKTAIARLKQAQSLAESMENRPMVFACTCARSVRALTVDEDPRDRRYLTGAITTNGFHVYCGGIDAALSRALAYAPYADVLCYWATKMDLGEAQRFASVIRATFPDKPLGVVFSLQQEFDSFCLHKSLMQFGYKYSFLTFAESLVFPRSPENRPWAFFDDRADPISPLPVGEG